jgi:uncharacterized protein involved in type VI secretion and phage assembly
VATYSPLASVSIDGTDLSKDLKAQLERVVVDFHLHLPAMFALTFDDGDDNIVSDTNVSIGSIVKVAAVDKDSGTPSDLIEGEVTAIEGDYGPRGRRIIIRGYDYSHRLHRGRTTETYQNVTTSDVVQQVVNRASLQIGQIDPTSVTHDQVSQANLSDWEFLKSLSRETGYEMVVEAGQFYFRQPVDAATAPDPGTFRSANSQQLVFGKDLVEFRPRVTAASQVGDVAVRGWDPDQKQIVVGSAQAKTTTAVLSDDPASLANDFGNMTFTAHDRPLADQSEADDAATSIAEQLGSAFAEAEGMALGNPDLIAGTTISVAKVSDTFQGKYTLSQVRHVFEDGYRTYFTVGGRQERSLFGLASGGLSNGSASAGGPPIYGVVVAVVSDNNDPNNQGRVKLALPWLSDGYVSDWARVTQFGAAKNSGAVWLPENDDEVLVAFEHGDIRRPYVVGNLYNGMDLPKSGTDLDLSSINNNGVMKQRGFMSRRGHQLIFYEDDSDAKISIVTSDGNTQIVIDEQNGEIKISSQGSPGKVTIDAAGDIELDSQGNIKLSAQQGINLEAQQSLSLKGTSGATLDGGSASAEVKASSVAITGSGGVNINNGALQVT